ncbi:MAG: AAA family ATPase [Nitrospirae bacterium]|nr:AAA family ATPase [Nitrospirota bacterium]
MRFLFVENFRGFDRQYISLEDVNFFVGENSTGKTSILALINLFSLPDFWINQDFNQGEYQFGNYRDIADTDYFRVGLIDCTFDQPDSEKPSLFAFLMEFHEKKGIPSISRFCYIVEVGLHGDNNIYTIVNTEVNTVQAFITDNKIKYKADTFKYDKELCGHIIATFDSWLETKSDDVDLTEGRFPFPIIKGKYGVKLLAIVDAIAIERNTEVKWTFVPSFSQNPYFADNFTWIEPVRSKPKKTYDQIKLSYSAEGQHVPYLIKNLLEDKKLKQAIEFRKFMQKYGKESGLFKDLEIKKFGEDSASAFELRIVLDDKPLNINSVGYGVSQSLPILVEFFARAKNSWFAIQQPEVHLHPRAQAALGDVLYDLAIQAKERFFIETHSDFIIDRFRLKINRGKDILSSQVVFFERTDGLNKASSIKILPNGKYEETQPESFRNFFIKEELSILGIR